MACDHRFWLAKIDGRGEGIGNVYEMGVFFCRKCLEIRRVKLD